MQDGSNTVLRAHVGQSGAVDVETSGFDIAFETGLRASQIRFVLSKLLTPVSCAESKPFGAEWEVVGLSVNDAGARSEGYR